MRQLPFFGLGPDSSLSDETDFTLLEENNRVPMQESEAHRTGHEEKP
jgi:hypothetical protein